MTLEYIRHQNLQVQVENTSTWICQQRIVKPAKPGDSLSSSWDIGDNTSIPKQ